MEALNYKTLITCHGEIIKIDPEFYDELSKYRWGLRRGYPSRTTSIKGKPINYTMHRLLTGAKKGEYVDHINGDKLDNRLCNLRIVYSQQNNTNRRYAGFSGYKGVTYISSTNRYVAKWLVNGKHKSKSFLCPIEAAKYWDARTKEIHGEFAYTNFNEKGEKNPLKIAKTKRICHMWKDKTKTLNEGEGNG